MQSNNNTSPKVHWLGAGLSSTPGIQSVAKSGLALTVWNRTLPKAQEAIAGLNLNEVVAREYSLASLQTELRAGDIVVSMLPANMHPEVGEVCLQANAHLVTTSYISPAMKNLHESARKKNLCFLNETGLDPGLDHILAHELVYQYQHSEKYSPKHTLSLKSLCGGFPEKVGEFCYKFSWSPLGVLKALTNQARFISEGRVKQTQTPWKELFTFNFQEENFEAYPNRDSLPYIDEYFRGEQDKQVCEFIRGTIRPRGWSTAWKHVFECVEKNNADDLEALSVDLWNKYKYTDYERDRILLYVELSVFHGDLNASEQQPVWSKSLVLNEYGSGKFTAMARTVSLPAAFAVDAILNGIVEPGVSTPPRSREKFSYWLKQLQKNDITIVGLAPIE